ncbi:MAG: DUF4124 domain-containing protein [Proteobacteria bacterium]|nr:DUF4124 domain-containing protein [Pseudomonadota bacterium]
MNKAYVVIALCAFVVPGDIHADVHKCADADGNIMYSQTPCAAQVSANVNMAGFSSQSTAMDCSYANRFALSTARRMRVGTGSTELFNLYGGLDELSKGALGVINYVYSFLTSSDVSVEQIATLTETICQAQSLGIVNCKALPSAYTESIGGCAVADEKRTVAAEQERPAVRTAPTGNVVRTQTRPAQTNEFTEQCQKWYRDSIEQIDAQMQRDHSPEEGEFYRKELHELTQRLREC